MLFLKQVGFLCLLAFSQKNENSGIVENINLQVRPSIVVLKTVGRNEGREALGTGFYISKDGLIATNYHVIGEGKKVIIESFDGKSVEATEIVHIDRENDLAVIRGSIKPDKWLELATNKDARSGVPIVAVGNPQGLKHSVVSGVLSGKREIDGREMLQLAIPIEPGNSGGPIVNSDSKVLGVVTIKSLVTENLGFAVPVDSLSKLLNQKPISVSMKAWATIGALDDSLWDQIFEGKWRQRAGKIFGEGNGNGFGGRSLLISKKKVPEKSYEVECWIKLDDEAGAAGIVFGSDSQNRQYGFYPSNSQMRLTHFKGPDVYSWQVLKQESFEFYSKLDWNHLRVVVLGKMFNCYLNGKLVYEVQTDESVMGSVGLARFRGTKAQFKGFKLGRLQDQDPKTIQDIKNAIGELVSNSNQNETVESLVRKPELAKKAIDGEIKIQLEKINKLKSLKEEVAQKEILSSLNKLAKEKNANLVEAALWISKMEHPEIHVSEYMEVYQAMEKSLKTMLPAQKITAENKIEILNKFFFAEKGFHGSIHDYYSKSNSCMSEVLDDREGIPITLSIVYMQLARSLGVPMEGFGFPGHFMVGFKPDGELWKIVDVYDGGKVFSMKDALIKIKELSGKVLEAEDVKPATDREILVRVLTNLSNISQREKDDISVVRFLSGILELDPESFVERSTRALVLSRLGRFEKALKDVNYLLENEPEGLNVDKMREFKLFLENQMKKTGLEANE